MAWTGDYLAVVAELLNERPMDDIVRLVLERNPVYARITKAADRENFYGEYAKIVMHTTAPMNAGPRPEKTDVMLPLPDVFKETHITLAQYMSSIGWTQEEAEDAVLANASALANLVEFKIANAPLDMRWKLNDAFAGDGTGRLARVASYSGGTVTVDNTQADFGWPDVSRIRNGMLVDIYTVGGLTVGSSTFTTKCTKCIVSAVSRTGKTFVITAVTGDSGSAIDASPANSDYVFVSGAVATSTRVDGTFQGWNGAMGLHGIVDAGGSIAHEFTESGNLYNGSYYGATFQNLTRASYPQLLGHVYRADSSGWLAGGTAGTVGTCTLSVINDYIRSIDEEGDGGGLTTALYMNGATRDWMARLAYAERNAFVQANDGRIVPGVVIESFRSATGRLIPVVPMSTLPNGVIYGGDERDLILFEKIPLGWHFYNGQKSFASPGSRNLTMESWLRTRLQLGAKACWNWFRIEDIDITA